MSLINKEEHNPESILIAGCKLLSPILEPYGFLFVLEKTGVGSGGRFASAKYVRGDRSLELHFRYSLGLVSYHIGNVSLDHEIYMRMLGFGETCSYPDFPKQALDSFGSLAKDLKLYCGDFLSGNGDQFRKLAEGAEKPALPQH